MNKNQRTIFMIDLDNVFGGSSPTRSQVNGAAHTLDGLRSEGHMVVLAATHHLVSVAGWIAPWARWRWRSGPDGPAEAIAEVLANEAIQERFTHVVLMSGNGSLAGPIAHLAANGVRTTVVCADHKLSKRLRLAAHDVICDRSFEEASVDAA